MNARAVPLPSIYLNPGEIHFSEAPGVVEALLGSTLSVTLFCRRLSAGAICHGLLPECPVREQCGPQCADRLNYIECSLDSMICHFTGRGVSVCEIDAKIFGGTDMFPVAMPGQLVSTVGFRNFFAAMRVSQRMGINVVSIDVGGMYSRQIAFYPHTGKVLVKRLDKRDNRAWLTF